MELKRSHLRNRGKQAPKHVFQPSPPPPGFDGFIPNLTCSHFRPKPSWSTKSRNRGVKSGGTSPQGVILQFRILTWGFPTHVGLVPFTLTDRNFVNPYNIERYTVPASSTIWRQNTSKWQTCKKAISDVFVCFKKVTIIYDIAGAL